MEDPHQNTTLEDHIKWQLDRAYSGFYEAIDPMEYAKKFQSSPFEASSILDCQTLELIMVENSFDKVFRMEGFQPQTIREVLQCIHEDHESKAMHFAAAILANETVFKIGEDSVSQVFKISSGVSILRTSTPLQADSNGHVIYVLDQYRDVTDLTPEGKFRWSLKGPNSRKIEKLVEASLQEECPLSPQELTILSYVGKGVSSTETAEKLFISKHTVDTHRRNILKKMDSPNTTAAYQKARRLGIIG